MEDHLTILNFRMFLKRGKGKFPPLFGVFYFMMWEDNSVNTDLIGDRVFSQVLSVKPNSIW